VRPASPRWLRDRLEVLRAVATEIGRLLSGRQDATPARRRQRILAFLHQRLADPVTLGELAAAVGRSPSRTGHLVRELFGMTFPRLVYSVKLREAARLLAATDLTIGEVAHHVGFQDPNYFTRVFSQEYGINPKQYRRQFPAEA
jgi:AraC-like DNA-binding protein